MKNILAVRNDRFGEFLLNIPVFRALKESFPAAKLTLAVDPYVEELARCIDGVDAVIVRENRKHSLAEVFKFSRELKKKNFDTCVILNPSREFNLISYLAGIPVRVGYSHKWPFLLTHKIQDKKYLAEKHEVEYNLELAGLIGAKTKDASLSLNLDDQAADNLFKGKDFQGAEALICIHPFTSDPFKQWPFENFRELARRLAREANIKLVIIGGISERQKSMELCANLNTDMINLTGRTTLKQLAVLLKKVKLLISGDSGPVHLAACLGTAAIVLFRNDIPAKGPKRWAPWGSGHIVLAKKSLFEISVDEVFNAALGRLYG